MKNEERSSLGIGAEGDDGLQPAEPSITFTLRGRREEPPPAPIPGNLPRITRLLALAIKMDGMIGDGIVQDYADLARLGFVSRPRMTQVMNLLNLAPDIQEEILSMPRTVKGRDAVGEGHVRPITGVLNWQQQRGMWRQLNLTEDRPQS